MDHLSNLIAPAVIAAIVSTAMSISLPWVNWGVEKRRLRRQRRVDHIDAVREFAQKHNRDLSELIETPEYAALREHFSNGFVWKIEGAESGGTKMIQVDIGRSGGLNNFKPELFDELTKLEIKWKLL